MPTIIGYTKIKCRRCKEIATVRKYSDRKTQFCSALCANTFCHPKTSPEKCTVLGCKKPHAGRGLCQMHRWRLNNYGDVNHKNIRHCSVKGCEKKYAKNGYCSLHFLRMKRTGTTDDPPVPILDTKRYIQRKIPNHPIATKNGRVLLHRAALYDKIGPGEHPCHWCGEIVSWEKSYPKHPDALIVDHLDHDRHNYSPENLVPACNPCNSQRRRDRPSLSL